MKKIKKLLSILIIVSMVSTTNSMFLFANSLKDSSKENLEFVEDTFFNVSDNNQGNEKINYEDLDNQHFDTENLSNDELEEEDDFLNEKNDDVIVEE